MLFQVYLSELIGPAGIGLLQLIMSVGSFAMTLGMSGVRTAAMFLCAEQYGKKCPRGAHDALSLCLFWGLLISTIVGLLLAFFAHPISLYGIKDARAALSLRIFALSLPINCYISILSGYFTACNRIGKLVLVEIIDRLLSVGCTFALLFFWSQADAEKACAATILGGVGASLITAIWMTLLVRRERRETSKIESPSSVFLPKRLLRLCIPFALNEYLRAGLSTLEQFLVPFGLHRYNGDFEASMSDYGTICGMVFPVLMFPCAILYSLSDLLIPELARCRASRNDSRIRHLTHTCLRMGFLYAGIISALMFLFAKPLSNLIYPHTDISHYLRLFAPTIVILYLDSIIDGMCKGLSQQVHCVRYNTLTSFLDVAFLFLLLPKIGVAGYLISFYITHIINFVLSLRLLLRTTRYKPHFKRIDNYLPNTYNDNKSYK